MAIDLLFEHPNPFYDVLRNVKLFGEKVVSRGLETLEVTGFNYVLPPRRRFMSFDHRKLKMDYIKQEFMWYLTGEPTDRSICKVASMWNDLINQDNSINSNYGYYIFNPSGGLDGRSNFDRVVDTLKADPYSRRAVMMILGSNHLNSVTKDYPCTVYLNFLIRNNQLLLFVRMRSQDAIYGMGNDAPFFSMVHELMFQSLKMAPQFVDLEMGEYKHSADSFHVYERHYKMLDQILADPVESRVEDELCPAMTLETPAYLRLMREELLKQTPYLTSFKEVKDPFCRWLVTRDDYNTLVLPDIR